MTDAQPVVAYFDGLTEAGYAGGRRNPGGFACGGWIVEPHAATGAAIEGQRFYRAGEGATNHVAEYEAALDALCAIYRTGYRGPVLLRGDSYLVVDQVMGRIGCYAPLLHPLHDKMVIAIEIFQSVVLEWIPREHNSHANALSRIALERARASYALTHPTAGSAA